MKFYIGQIFDGTYPPEAAMWCNAYGAHIEDITKDGAEQREFTIVANPPPPKTKTVRTFSKFSIWVATRDKPIAEGSDVMVWDAFEAFLHECKLWAGWNQLVDLVEDNPFFEQFYPIACEKLGRKLVDQVLAASVVSTQEVIVE